MNVAAVVAEFDPFHNGHLYLLRQAKRLAGADYVIAIMSGDFVQRGSPALIDKYNRARMALSGGADMVLELPCTGACASAEIFASSAISILDNLGIVTHLAFGCENDDLPLLRRIAGVLNEEPFSYRSRLKEELSRGKSFPEARAAAVQAITGEEFPLKTQSILEQPNNILAIEYLRALNRLQSRIEPVPVLRIGAGHDQINMAENSSCTIQEDAPVLLSAASIRQAVLRGRKQDIEKALQSMPSCSRLILEEYQKNMPPMDTDDFTDIAFHALLEHQDTLADYFDVTDEIAARLYSALNRACTLTQLSQYAAGRNITQARIRRCIFHVILGHSKSLIEGWKAQNYQGGVNVLGIRRGSRSLLSAVRPGARKEMILRSADRNKLDTMGAAISERDLYASELYRAVCRRKTARSCDRLSLSILSEPLIVL